MNELSEFQALQQSLNDSDFVLKTQEQIAKDFGKFNLFFPEEFTTTALSKETIESFVSERIADLMQEGETRLLQLLYTIDLPEKEFLSLTTQADFLAQLSQRILFREAYKVYLRKKFSSSGKNPEVE
jgi:hypothetical protein